MRYFGNNIRLMVNNLLVSYTDQGPDEAPVIIFIHGFPLNKTMWYKQVESLKETYRIITYDIRGHGESDSGDPEFSIDLFVNDLISFMDKLGLDKVALCGLSMGGYIALNAIVNYPERFVALVLSDTQCLADSREAKEKRSAAIEAIRKNGVVEYANESIKNLFTADSFSTNTDEIELVKKMIVNTPAQSLCNTLLALSSRNETCTRLPEINVPLLILVGDDDKITPLPLALMMQEKIKGSLLQVIEHAGHLSCLENPEAFNEHLITFFESVYKKQSDNNSSGDGSILKNLKNKLNSLVSLFSV